VIELLTGHPPYWDRGPLTALYKITNADSAPIPNEASPVRIYVLPIFNLYLQESLFFKKK